MHEQPKQICASPFTLRYLPVLCAILLAVYLPGFANAQTPQDTAALVGNWAYRLGPNRLFALHLEPDPVKPSQLRGYMLRPEHFSMDTPGGTVIHCSHIENQSKREPLESTGWQQK